MVADLPVCLLVTSGPCGDDAVYIVACLKSGYAINYLLFQNIFEGNCVGASVHRSSWTFCPYLGTWTGNVLQLGRPLHECAYGTHIDGARVRSTSRCRPTARGPSGDAPGGTPFEGSQRLLCTIYGCWVALGLLSLCIGTGGRMLPTWHDVPSCFLTLALWAQG